MADITDIIKSVKALAVDFGTASAGAAAGSSSLTDASKSWAPGMHQNRLVRIVAGAGAGQTRLIADNGASALTTTTPWSFPLDATSEYVILNPGAEIILASVALLVARLGNPDADVLKSLAAKLGDLQRPLYDTLDEIGRYDVAGLCLSMDVITILDNLAEIINDLGPAGGSTLGSVYAILGNPAQSLAAMIGYEGGAGLASKLTAARAALLDRLDADVSSRAAPGAAMALTAAEETAIQGKVIDDATPFHGASVAAIKANTDRLPRVMGFMDFWSPAKVQASLGSVAADIVLNDIVVAGPPAGVAVARVVAMFKFRTVANTNAAANSVAGAQNIQVRSSAPGVWRNAVPFAAGMYALGASSAEGGDLLIGNNDISVEVAGNGTYNVQWAQAVAAQNNLNFNDIQVGLRVYFTI